MKHHIVERNVTPNRLAPYTRFANKSPETAQQQEIENYLIIQLLKMFIQQHQRPNCELIAILVII
ncbi:MAG: hypothetical protein ACTS73_04165 [Arsenophonus sp. NEOnobi-MAG3]